MKTNKFISKFTIFLIIFSILFTVVPVNKVEAKVSGHDTNVLLPTINSNGRYAYTVVIDENDWGKSLETGGTGYDIFNDGFSYLKFLTSSDSDGDGVVDKVDVTQSIDSIYKYNKEISNTTITKLGKNPGSDWDMSNVLEYNDGTNMDFLHLSFPGHDAGGWGDNQYNKNDYARANEVGANLIKSLNNALDYIDALDGEDNISVDNLGLAVHQMTGSILKNPLICDTNQYVTMDIRGSKVTIVYCGRGGKEDTDGKNGIYYYYDAATKDKQLYAYIIDEEVTSITDDKLKTYPKFVWAQLKGYLDEDGNVVGTGEKHDAYVTQNCSTTNVNSGTTGTALKDIGDITWLTIFDLANVANYYYYSSNASLDFSASTNVAKPGFIEETIATIALKLVNELKNLLGLEDVTALVYHTEGGSVTGGVMDMKWWSVMLKYHLIFQILAWMVIGLALCKTILELNLSTINPNKRVSIMEEVQKLLMVGFLLALAVPIIRAMIELNNIFVGIFATQMDLSNGDLSAFSGLSGLAGVLFAFMYLGLAMTINCVYIMRGVMIAIFGASAPLFIVSMLFVKGKGMFDQWLKEMAANIFLQTVHAFSYAFLMEVIKAGSGLASLVVVYSLMPITEQFRNLIFGGAGSAVGLGGQAAGGLTQMGMSAVKAGASIGGQVGANTLMNRTKMGQMFKDSGGEGSDKEGSGGSESGVVGGKMGNTMKKLGDNAVKNAKSDSDKRKARAMQLAGMAMNMGSSSFDAMGNMMMSGIGMATGNQQMATQHAKASFDSGAASINEGTSTMSNALAENRAETTKHVDENGVTTEEKSKFFGGKVKTVTQANGDWSRESSYKADNGRSRIKTTSVSTGANGEKVSTVETYKSGATKGIFGNSKDAKISKVVRSSSAGHSEKQTGIKGKHTGMEMWDDTKSLKDGFSSLSANTATFGGGISASSSRQSVIDSTKPSTSVNHGLTASAGYTGDGDTVAAAFDGDVGEAFEERAVRDLCARKGFNMMNPQQVKLARDEVHAAMMSGKGFEFTSGDILKYSHGSKSAAEGVLFETSVQNASVSPKTGHVSVDANKSFKNIDDKTSFEAKNHDAILPVSSNPVGLKAGAVNQGYA